MARNASERPDAPAVAYKGEGLTYAALHRRVLEAAGGLREIGVVRNDRVGIYLEKRLEAVVAQFGATAAAAVFVPINPMLRAKQAAYILQNCGVRVLVTPSARLKSLAEVLPQCRALEAVVLVDETAGGNGAGPTLIAWQSFLAAGDNGASAAERGIDTDMVAILFTSGSTGMPKGVVLSHRNLVASARSASQHLGNTAEDRILCVLPFSFDYGIVQVTSAFNVGASIVLFNYLLPRDVMAAVHKERITGLAGVPTLWIQLAQHEWPDESKRLRYITNSGGAMPGATLARLREKLPNTAIHLMYGLTEAFRSTCLPPSELDRRPNSIGQPIPNAEVMVVREDGSRCDAGELGELVHRGSFVTKGYWHNPERTAERFKPAPLQPAELNVPEIAVWSGDFAWYDEDGFYYFVGRRDDQIKTSGYRVSPTEVEKLVYGTHLVGEAAALGLPHPVLGQAVVVVATSPLGGQLDKARLLERCREEMPTYMVPLAIIERPSLPKTPNGKMDRKQLAAELANLFDGADS